MRVSPWVTGTFGLISAMAIAALAMAMRLTSFTVPRETFPLLSGVEVWTIATSISTAPERNMNGSSAMVVGTMSSRPICIARALFSPMLKVLNRHFEGVMARRLSKSEGVVSWITSMSCRFGWSVAARCRMVCTGVAGPPLRKSR